MDDLLTLRKLNSHLQGHPDMKQTPGVEASTGSLGQGLSIANGMALAAKLDGGEYRVYALLGDGELEEGMVWEAVMTSSHYNLDNLVAIVDYNKLQIDGDVREVMVLPCGPTLRSFGWLLLIRWPRYRSDHICPEPSPVLRTAYSDRSPHREGRVYRLWKPVGWLGSAPPRTG